MGGTVTPDAYRIAADGSVTHTVGDTRTRLDRKGTQVAANDVPTPSRYQPSIDDVAAVRLARLGAQVAAVLGAPQDVEWAIADGVVWLLQARPITARSPARDTATNAAFQIAWLVRHALDAPPGWLGLDSANTALTVIDYRAGLAPTVVMFNDMSHLPAQLRWTGFPDAARP